MEKALGNYERLWEINKDFERRKTLRDQERL